jgi:hypothetical protein
LRYAKMSFWMAGILVMSSGAGACGAGERIIRRRREIRAAS